MMSDLASTLTDLADTPLPHGDDLESNSEAEAAKAKLPALRQRQAEASRYARLRAPYLRRPKDSLTPPKTPLSATHITQY